MNPSGAGGHTGGDRSHGLHHRIPVALQTLVDAGFSGSGGLVSIFKIDFDAIEWQEGREGVRYKVYSEGARQLRLVEFATADGDPHWCERGHIGYVLSGGLSIEVDGAVHAFTAGDGLFLPSGAATAHRGVAITPGTRLIMVEDA
jgi:hypothetical protein